jgi:hypothetical protein
MKTKSATASATLKRRIRHFYTLLSDGQFERCYEMIDPRVRQKSESVTLLQYEDALVSFVKSVGSIGNLAITIDLHVGEPSRLYEDRDFAIGRTTWQDIRGHEHVFAERWVREGDLWYTRSTGCLSAGDGSTSRRKRS